MFTDNIAARLAPLWSDVAPVGDVFGLAAGGVLLAWFVSRGMGGKIW